MQEAEIYSKLTRLHCYAMEGTVDENKNVDLRELEQILGEHSEIFQNHSHGLPPPPTF